MFLERPIAAATNWWLTRLRNRVDLRLTREEFQYSQISFSQFGEDLAVLRWIHDLHNIPKIFIDAGCFHPIHCSNTLLLHKRAWRGVNIDMHPEKIAAFCDLRPNDYNVTAALSDAEHTMEMLQYDAYGNLTDRLRAFDEPDTASVVGEACLRRKRVTTKTLNSIIADTEWRNQRIGYLNIDCEGHDLKVLKGFDLAIYQPTIITIEAHDQAIESTLNYLLSAGYVHKETLKWTFLFIRGDQLI
jgi:FkbM family methyltransferase